MEEQAVLARIEGRVQGVWYRGWTVDEARARNLRGWVRNRRDGSVEAVFCGPASAVGEMIAACWKGPPAAMVTKVTSGPTNLPEETGFSQRPTV